MLIAIPVKFNKENPPISPLFGHAKYFAFIKDNEIKIEENPYDGGVQVVNWLLEKEVDVIITQHIGLKPFVLLHNEGVKCYFGGDGRILLKDAIENFKKGNLEEINEENIEKFARHQHRH
ncbi:NifB/NifX family molybdenum-iron cluster-binding protein [Nitrosophilus kaiyonis]|uniref:NifB/NifX family molybdenum-iron cluster-binding protein n=1 Tax=Nitrosophilus kaiyonis TaxID=2930200 RepID=UPI0024933C48|nr:NifB/NifX family molybdenum-iron cluster-binding protein [Nitrosophilus kaiyonis]